MNTANNSVEQKCYLDFLVAKYITAPKENKYVTVTHYNTTPSIAKQQPTGSASNK